MLNTESVVRWFESFNILSRQHTPETTQRFLECFWRSQLTSKLWLIERLKSLHLLGYLSNTPVFVYGGWYGVLGQMLYDETRCHIISVDIDPACEQYGAYFAPDVTFLTADMIQHHPEFGSVSINTSSEHITQEDYDQWIQRRPHGSLVVVQGNNFFANTEHVRCHHTLTEFVAASGISCVVDAGELDCGDFTRFMVIGFK